MFRSAFRALPEYPDGDLWVTLSSEDPAGRDFGHVGWATIVLKQTKGVHKDRLRKQCLGVFACPVKDCVCRSAENATKGSCEASCVQLTRPRYLVLGGWCCCGGHCQWVFLSLVLLKAVYQACSVQIVFSTAKSSGLLEMQHRGTHGHARPPPARAPPSVSLAFAQSVLAAPSRPPKDVFSSSSSSDVGGVGGETKSDKKEALHPAIGKSLTTVRNKRQSVLRAAFSVAQLKTSKAWADRGVTVVADEEGEAIAFAASIASLSLVPSSPLATELVPLLPGTTAAAKSLLVTVAFSIERLRFVPVGVTLVLAENKPSAAQLEAHVKRLFSPAEPDHRGMLLCDCAEVKSIQTMVCV
jgi:hypothetical protein